MTDIARRLAELTPAQRELLQQHLISAQRNEADAPAIPSSQNRDHREPSSGEERLWFLDQLGGSSALYNISSAVRLSGKPNVDAVESSLQALVSRHEIFRTRYTSDFGALRIVVSPESEVEFDLRRVDGGSCIPESALIAAVREEAARPFLLDADVLLRAVLYRCGESDHVLQLTTHHIASDGWSQEILWHEFAELYNARINQRAAELPQLTTLYADYARWMRSPEKSADLSEAVEWWTESLRGSSTVLELPTDHPRPNSQAHRGSVRSYVLSEEMVNALLAFSGRERATPFMVLLAALYAVLHRYTGQDRILVGSPMAARVVPDIEGIIGFFANTVAIPGDLSGDPTFRDLIAQVRGVSLDAFGHQDVPFESVVQRLNPERDSSRSPLVQVMLALDNNTSEALKLDGLTTSRQMIHTGTSKFDLTIHAAVSRDAGTASLEFDSDLFEPETIDRFWSHLTNFLESAIARPADRISTIPLLGAEERSMMLNAWNATDEEYPRSSSLAKLVTNQAELTPDATAVVFADRRLSYRELNDRANQLAAELIRRGVRPGSPVGICVERSAEMMVGLLAIVKAGGAYVPVDPSIPIGRASYILTDSGVELLVTQQALPEAVSQFAGAVVFVDAGEWMMNDRTDPGLIVSSETLAYIIYTSGSTGKPKGVRVSQRAVLNLMYSMRARFGLDASDRVLAVTTSSFDIAGADIWLPWLAGATTFIADRSAASNGEELAELISRHDITFLQATPTTWWLLFGAGWTGKRNFQGAFSGEAIARDLAARAVTSMDRFWNLYGPTETTIWSTGVVMREPVQPGCVGRPLGNTQCYVLNADREPQPIGVTGELYIAGDGVADGYQNRPDLTEQVFVRNPFSTDPTARMYRTGDLARYRASGDIELIGRADNQIKIRGYRIEPGEVESVLAQHGSIRRSVVTARLNAIGEKVLVAYVVSGAVPASTTELRHHLKQSLPEYMIPSAFVQVTTLPLTASGKIDLNALPDPEASETRTLPHGRELETATQRLVATAWSDVLGSREFGIDDDFFELGGHSLNATQVIARLRVSVDPGLPVRILFDNPTIGALSEAIEMHVRERAGAGNRIVAPDRDHGRREIQEDREAPLSFVQEQLWLVDQLQPGNVAYIIGCTLEFSADLDVAALRQALTEIVRRHEVLRTTFTTRDGVPIQLIHSDAGVELRVTRLAETAVAEQEMKRAQIEVGESGDAFDLEHGSPIRFHLLDLGGGRYRLIVSAHHIALDGWSIQIFIRELGLLYTAISNGRTVDLPEPAWQYADFATWQRDELAAGALEPLLEYWRGQLEAAPPVIGLPLDRPRPAVRSFAGGSVTAVIEPSVVTGLRMLAKEGGATLFMTMLAAYKLLLLRLSGESDISVGVPIAGRTRVETESMLGCFLNTLPFRTRIDSSGSFRQLLCDVRTVALEAYAHQDVPFDLLVERLRPQRSLSYTPFFQVLFNMLNMPSAPDDLGSVRIESRDGADASAKFELTVYAQEWGDRIALEMVFSTDVYTRVHAEVMLRQYCELLEQIVAAPDAALGDYALLAGAAQQLLPDPTAEQSREWAGSVADLFAARAAASPDAVALVDGAAIWTYGDLDRHGNQLAHRLAELGVTGGDVVAIFAERSAALVWALMGVFKIGGAFVVLDRAYPPQRLADYVDVVRPRAVIVLGEAGSLPDALAAALDRASSAVCELPKFASVPASEQLWNCASTRPDVTVGPDDMAYVAFTSGTTGRPKGIIGRHGSLTHFTRWTAAEFGLNEHDRYSLLSGLAHDPLHRDVFTPLQLGACICVPAPDVVYDPTRLRDWIGESGITVAHLTPAMGQLLASSSTDVVSDTLRLAFFVGDALTRRDVARLHDVAPNVRIINYYGTTETQRAVSLYVTDRESENDRAYEVVPLGHGLPDVQLLVVTSAGKLAGIGELGEVYVRSPHIAKSYLDDDALTAERFVANPITQEIGDRCYRTGDLGRYNADGDVVAVGRADAQVKIRGFRVELAEIEATLGRHPLVSDCVVAAPTGPNGERQLAAYIVARGDAPADDELRTMLRDRLPSYMIVSSFTFLDALPLTPNGKIDRRALPAPKFGVVNRARTGHAKGPVHFELVKLWQEMLHVPNIGIDDDFFELGGHSLIAAAMMERVAAIFDTKPPLSVLFEEATIRHLTNSLMNNAGFVEPGAVCIQRGMEGRVPLFFFHGDYIGGGLYCRKLLKYLDPDMPVYVVAPHEAGGPETIQAMAADLLPSIREVQPHGPYLLTGYCNGGVVALEVAATLRDVGEAVEFLGVIDVGARNVQLASFYALLNRVGKVLGFDQRRQLDTFMLLREPALRLLDTELPPIEKSSGLGERVIFTTALASLLVRRVIRRCWRAVSGGAGRGSSAEPDAVAAPEQLRPEEKRRVASSQYITRAMFNYIPRPYDGVITVIGATEGREDASMDHLDNWRSISGQVNQIVIRGTHMSIVTSDIAELGEVLREQVPRI